ncbi:DoxX family protein [Streptomyces sp. NPDC002926]
MSPGDPDLSGYPARRVCPGRPACPGRPGRPGVTLARRRDSQDAGAHRSWMPALGVPKAATALGLLVGFWIPSLGPAAAVGLVLFSVCGVVTQLRVRDYKFGLQSVPGAGRRDSAGWHPRRERPPPSRGLSTGVGAAVVVMCSDWPREGVGRQCRRS